MPTFISVCLILDMRMVTCILIFFPAIFLKFSKFFCILFKNLLLYIWSLICLSLEENDSLLFTFILKKPYFPIFHTNSLRNISPYFRAFANLGCQIENKLK